MQPRRPSYRRNFTRNIQNWQKKVAQSRKQLQRARRRSGVALRGRKEGVPGGEIGEESEGDMGIDLGNEDDDYAARMYKRRRLVSKGKSGRDTIEKNDDTESKSSSLPLVTKRLHSLCTPYNISGRVPKGVELANRSVRARPILDVQGRRSMEANDRERTRIMATD